jgi:hypothetical protein
VGGLGQSLGSTFFGSGGGDDGGPAGRLVLGGQGRGCNAHGCIKSWCGIDVNECAEESDDN